MLVKLVDLRAVADDVDDVDDIDLAKDAVVEVEELRSLVDHKDAKLLKTYG